MEGVEGRGKGKGGGCGECVGVVWGYSDEPLVCVLLSWLGVSAVGGFPLRFCRHSSALCCDALFFDFVHLVCFVLFAFPFLSFGFTLLLAVELLLDGFVHDFFDGVPRSLIRNQHSADDVGGQDLSVVFPCVESRRQETGVLVNPAHEDMMMNSSSNTGANELVVVAHNTDDSTEKDAVPLILDCNEMVNFDRVGDLQ